ncbi:MAG: metallophosphoesterase [Halothece sp. Uz-M2-17]|nr:metallophosphoesterase [Halothece sp. Uz-M2-17]
MSFNFRFGIASDLHIAVEETIFHHPKRFHLVEVSIPSFKQVIEHFKTLDLDFLLLPGDLTQDGEPENHQWLADYLQTLPFPVYVIPGNHDIPTISGENPHKNPAIPAHQFPNYYSHCGYHKTEKLYYTTEIYPGVQLVALNSNIFDANGKQLGCLDEEQLQWLENLLPTLEDQLVLVMIHHNVIEHFPGQADHELSNRYMLDNAPRLKELLKTYGVRLIFTGHLHIQDIAKEGSLYEITTGSMVSYPHPYRVIEISSESREQITLNIQSHWVKTIPGWEDLLDFSREWMGDRADPFMMKLLTKPPLNLPVEEAKQFVPDLRYFWAEIAQGDAVFSFPHFPPQVKAFFEKFSEAEKLKVHKLSDNHTQFHLKSKNLSRKERG